MIDQMLFWKKSQKIDAYWLVVDHADVEKRVAMTERERQCHHSDHWEEPHRYAVELIEVDGQLYEQTSTFTNPVDLPYEDEDGELVEGEIPDLGGPVPRGDGWWDHLDLCNKNDPEETTYRRPALHCESDEVALATFSQRLREWRVQ